MKRKSGGVGNKCLYTKFCCHRLFYQSSVSVNSTCSPVSLKYSIPIHTEKCSKPLTLIWWVYLKHCWRLVLCFSPSLKTVFNHTLDINWKALNLNFLLLPSDYIHTVVWLIQVSAEARKGWQLRTIINSMCSFLFICFGFGFVLFGCLFAWLKQVLACNAFLQQLIPSKEF